jgi:hypothetical protein
MFNIQSRKINSEKLEDQLNQLTCIYRNESEFIQIIRISQTKHFFERSVLPNQCVQFSASVNALLEIYEATTISSVYADTIPCSQLAVSSVHDTSLKFIAQKMVRR